MGAKNYANLTKKTITDAKGNRRTVWVKTKDKKEQKKKHSDRVTVMEGGKKVSYSRQDAKDQGYKKKHFVND